MCLLVHIWDIHNYLTCVEYKPRFLLCIQFLQCTINVTNCVILIFLLLFFLLAVSWFLLVVFQHFSSRQNFAFRCLITFAHLLSNFKCLLGVMRKLGSYGFQYCLLQTLSQIIIFIFLWKKTFIFFHIHFMSFYFYEI